MTEQDMKDIERIFNNLNDTDALETAAKIVAVRFARLSPSQTIHALALFSKMVDAILISMSMDEVSDKTT